MSDAALPQETPAKKSRLPLIIGLVMALILGGAGFYATFTGLILAPKKDDGVLALPPIAFVPLEPVVISLGTAANRQHLRFQAQLEVDTAHQAEVALLTPRILDVLNSYLRAVAVSELEDGAALVRIRAQMLRRIQIVTGEGRVRDLLITEFVLN